MSAAITNKIGEKFSKIVFDQLRKLSWWALPAAGAGESLYSTDCKLSVS